MAAASTARPIVTNYFFEGVVVKTNRAKYANRAVLCCVDHLQLTDYNTDSAEVYDERNGELHAAIKYDKTGKITILYQRPVKRGM